MTLISRLAYLYFFKFIFYLKVNIYNYLYLAQLIFSSFLLVCELHSRSTYVNPFFHVSDWLSSVSNCLKFCVLFCKKKVLLTIFLECQVSYEFEKLQMSSITISIDDQIKMKFPYDYCSISHWNRYTESKVFFQKQMNSATFWAKFL